MITVFNFFALVTARFVMGLCVGSFVTICPLFISEIVPKTLAGPLGIMPQLLAMTGLLSALSLSLIVPYSDTDEAMTTQTWKLIFFFPAVLISTQLILLFSFFHYDTPRYYQMTKDPVSHSKILSLIYKSHPESSLDSPPKTHSQVHLPPPVKALVIGLLLSFFHQSTGINSITFFSIEIFTHGETGSSAELSARLGTLGVGVVSVLGSS